MASVCSLESQNGEKHLNSEMHLQGRWQSEINTCINRCLGNSARHKAAHLTITLDGICEYILIYYDYDTNSLPNSDYRDTKGLCVTPEGRNGQ